MTTNQEPNLTEPQVTDLQNWAGNWIWRATQCLVEASDFDPSPKWLAARLNITVEKAVDAIEGLERLRFIEKSNGSYKPTSQWTQFTPAEMSRREILLVHGTLVPQITAKLSEKDKFTTQFFLGNRDLVARYTPRFMKLYKEMNDEGLKLGLTEVIASDVSFAQLTQSANSGGAQ